MSETLWRVVDIDVVRSGETSILTIKLLSEGREHIVAISGTKDMQVRTVINALRAALMHYVRANGGKLEIEGARDATPEELATGAKRDLN